MVIHPGSVAICPVSQPTVPDFSCGFQPHLSSGTRSRVVRVFFISWSNSGSIDWPMVMLPPLRNGFERKELRRIKSELSRLSFRAAVYDAGSSRFVARLSQLLAPGFTELPLAGRAWQCRAATGLVSAIAGEQNAAMPHHFSTSYVQDSIGLFRYYKRLAERAMEQCPDEGLFATLDTES